MYINNDNNINIILTFEKHIWPFTKYKVTYRNILKTTNSFHSEMATFQVKEKASSIELSCNFESERLKYRYIYIYVLISVLYYYIWNNKLFSYMKHEHCPNVWVMYLHVSLICRPDLWSVSASVLKEAAESVISSGVQWSPFVSICMRLCCSWVWRRGAVMTACHNTLREACTHPHTQINPCQSRWQPVIPHTLPSCSTRLNGTRGGLNL